MSLTDYNTELSRTETTKISVYTKDLRRCSHNCPFIIKRYGEYFCTKYNETVDGRFEDTNDMYGFERSEHCIKDFGFKQQEQNEKITPFNEKPIIANISEEDIEKINIKPGKLELYHDTDPLQKENKQLRQLLGECSLEIQKILDMNRYEIDLTKDFQGLYECLARINEVLK